jgi:23S rRNA (pseudouridine1915-N3)-methyltransferase
MRIGITAVGRMKSGPEAELATRYAERFARSGPAIGLDYSGLSEITESRRPGSDERKAEEADRILAGLPDGAMLVALDENGRDLSSRDLSERIARERDEGRRAMVFAIGGPDGHGPAVLERAELALRFGRLTWPHQIARILLAEQLYRATTILSGHPYHRD